MIKINKINEILSTDVSSLIAPPFSRRPLSCSSDPVAVLKSIWGFSSFRGSQESIIKTILLGRDCLAVMATGSGKSLCYQLPSLILPGVTIVISPLIALMNDQREQLKEYGVESVLLNSSLSQEEYSHNLERLITGEARLLFIAPEGLVNGRLLRTIKEKNILVSLIAVDEAHCVSMWGQDFRTDYLRIKDFRSNFLRTPCLALTATATKKVQSDIIDKLALSNPAVFISTFNRPNIYLEVERKVSNGFSQVVNFLDNHEGESGIIYCFSRDEVDKLAAYLKVRGFSILPYHAGLDPLTRTKNQDDFIHDRVRIIAATIAFGMGIDKSDVRFVLHCDISKSIEQYYQEIGRAGRDGLPAVAHLLYKASDAMKIRTFFNEVSNKVQAERLLNLMCDYASTVGCRRKVLLSYFGESLSGNNSFCCDNCARGVEGPFDITTPAQKFMCCVVRAGRGCPPSYISSILRGINSKKIYERGHNKLSTYGIGREYSNDTWSEICSALASAGYISIGEFRHLSVTNKGMAALKAREKIFLSINLNEIERESRRHKKRMDGARGNPIYSTLPTLERYNKTAVIDCMTPEDRALYNDFRLWRSEKARVEGVTTGSIFFDSVLFDIIKKRPKTVSDLEDISGLGAYKINKWGDEILSLVKKSIL